MSRSRRVRVAACWGGLLLAGLALQARPAQAQFRGVRFEITQVGDTTFGFNRGDATWVKEGTTGIAVDPRRRDVLVARFRVIAVDTGFVTALITGQTTRVATEHVVVLSEPPRPWYKVATFWGGTVVGLVLGVLAGSR
jgi:hypothetical protein